MLRTSGRQHEGELDRGSTRPCMAAIEESARVSDQAFVSIAEGTNPAADVVLPFRGQRYR